VGFETGTLVEICVRITEELGIFEGIDCGTFDDFKSLRARTALKGIGDGRLDGSELGITDVEGIDDGRLDGSVLGSTDGTKLGYLEGIDDGSLDGSELGIPEGIELGSLEGIDDGTIDGS